MKLSTCFRGLTLNRVEKNIVGILGSGFGLYGYLPAVALEANTIALLRKDQPKFQLRSELAEFEQDIVWLDEDQFYQQINTLIICLSPEGQFLVVNKALNYPNIKKILLEKPLAVNPQKAAALTDVLIKSGITYRIGYNFQYTNWGRELLAAFKSNEPQTITIKWHFFAHHFAKDLNNWKRYHSQGGGVIRFYAIHLVALLARTGSYKLLSSKLSNYSDDEPYRWTGKFTINGVHYIDIDVNTAAKPNEFVVNMNSNQNTALKIELTDPFDEFIATAGNQDRRVNVIKPVLSSLDDDEQNYWNSVYTKANNLWAEIETSDQFLH